MKSAIVASVAATLLFGAASATPNDCRGGVLYCGKTLRNLGKFSLCPCVKAYVEAVPTAMMC